jgi:hypothetical protein
VDCLSTSLVPHVQRPTLQEPSFTKVPEIGQVYSVACDECAFHWIANNARTFIHLIGHYSCRVDTDWIRGDGHLWDHIQL